MGADSQTVKVKAVAHEVCVYQVESWGQPGMHHTCSLLEAGGNGACTCSDYFARCIGNLRRNPNHFIEYGSPKNKNPNRTRCRHLTAAVRFFSNEILRKMSENLDH